MIHDDQATFDIIFDNGGCWRWSVGYCVVLSTDKIIEVWVLHQGGYRKYALPSTPIHQWHYWSVTYTHDDVNVFINGCNSAPFSIEYDAPRREAHTQDAEFHIGDWSGGGLAPHVTIDELMIWNRVLTDDQIWQLYVQGGKVWITSNTIAASKEYG